MAHAALERLMKKDVSLYKMILTAAARANELAQGAQPLVSTTTKKVATIALEEIASGKVSYRDRKSAQKKI